jgi:transcriptional regulator with XRE-family HTH domain
MPFDEEGPKRNAVGSTSSSRASALTVSNSGLAFGFRSSLLIVPWRMPLRSASCDCVRPRRRRTLTRKTALFGGISIAYSYTIILIRIFGRIQAIMTGAANPLRIHDLAGYSSRYTALAMEKAIRDFFRAERRRLKMNQVDVAVAGGLSQGQISKIEKNEDHEPGLTVFRKAVQGLGMSLSVFFAAFENPASRAHPSSEAPRRHTMPAGQTAITTADLDRFAEKLGESLGRILQPHLKPGLKKRRRRKKESSAIERSRFQSASDRERKDHHPE